MDYPGATNTILTGINDQGQIVGGYGPGSVAWSTTNIFLLDQGTFTPLSLPVGDIQFTIPHKLTGSTFVGFYVDSLGKLYGFEAQISGGVLSLGVGSDSTEKF